MAVDTLPTDSAPHVRAFVPQLMVPLESSDVNVPASAVIAPLVSEPTVAALGKHEKVPPQEMPALLVIAPDERAPTVAELVPHVKVPVAVIDEDESAPHVNALVPQLMVPLESSEVHVIAPADIDPLVSACGARFMPAAENVHIGDAEISA